MLFIFPVELLPQLCCQSNTVYLKYNIIRMHNINRVYSRDKLQVHPEVKYEGS